MHNNVQKKTKKIFKETNKFTIRNGEKYTEKYGNE